MDLLSNALVVDDKFRALIIIILILTVLTVINVAVNKLVSYAEGMHNEIIGHYINLDLMEKVLQADLELFDNANYYDKLLSVQRDSAAIAYIIWNVISCINALITFIGTCGVFFYGQWIYGVLLIFTAFPAAIIGHKYTKILYELSLSQVNDDRR